MEEIDQICHDIAYLARLCNSIVSFEELVQSNRRINPYYGKLIKVLVKYASFNKILPIFVNF